MAWGKMLPYVCLEAFLQIQRNFQLQLSECLRDQHSLPPHDPPEGPFYCFSKYTDAHSILI